MTDSPDNPNDPKIDLSSLITMPIEPAEGDESSGISIESLDEISEGPALGPDLEVSSEPLSTEPTLPPPNFEMPVETLTETTPIDNIRTYSETLAQSPSIGAAYPFTLKIEGKLTPQESEKLVAIVTRENMGIREVDLEPQIAEGKILIPRISEFAGVLLIQALRGVSAKISFGPSDEIFSTPDTRDDTAAELWTSQDTHAEAHISQEIPVSTSEQLPPFSSVEIVDTVIASGLLSTKSVEAKSSDEYATLVEALVRELKFKARRRGANGIISLQISLTPLTLPTDYRVTVSGSAVRGFRS